MQEEHYLFLDNPKDHTAAGIIKLSALYCPPILHEFVGWPVTDEMKRQIAGVCVIPSPIANRIDRIYLEDECIVLNVAAPQ